MTEVVCTTAPPGAASRRADDYRGLAVSLARALLDRQVVAEDRTLRLWPAGRGRLGATFATRLLRGDRDDVSARLELRRAGGGWRLWGVGAWSCAGPLGEGEFFRLDRSGRVGALPGFTGIRPGIRPGPDEPAAAPAPRRSLADRIKAAARRVGPLAAALRRLRDRVRPEPRADLAGVGGVTFRVRRIDGAGGSVELEAYDRGGFFDDNLNAEGLSYPAQVPGNYYADAYAALVFAELWRLTGEKTWLEGSRLALEFVRRVYPQYAPASIVWHHSDFKNPAFHEAVEQVLAPAGALPTDELAACRQLIARFTEDSYSPTNVFALRFHWHSARNRPEDGPAAARCLERLTQDQTADGLLHDNIATYPDAHDLTYHQYSLACLAQGLEAADSPEAEALFLKGVRFSLRVVTPDGEVAYVGRGANNVYHAASAVLAFEAAAGRAADAAETAAMRRAARRVFERLERQARPDGLLPTAMNALAGRRAAWNHCATPYNALSASFLLKAARLAAAGAGERPLPLDAPGHVDVMDEAGYAVLRSANLYAAVFGGCAESYAWSEGKHRTGVAGLAQFGVPGRGPLLPILDHPAGAAADPMTDLPVINGTAAYGRGALAPVPGPVPAVLYRHAYGGATVERLYLLFDEQLLALTRVRPDRAGRPLSVNGLAALPVRDGDGWTITVEPDGAVVSLGKEGRMTARVLHTEPALKVRPVAGRAWTNPRGLARRVEWAGGGLFRSAPPALHAALALDVGGPARPSARLAGDGVWLVEAGGARLVADLAAGRVGRASE